MTVRPWREMVRNDFIRQPMHSYSLTYDNSAGDPMAFLDDATKTISDVLEDAKVSNEKAGRIFSYKVSKDGMSATWRLAYTNVDRVITGKLKRFNSKRSA
jgi:hypothetical protein